MSKKTVFMFVLSAALVLTGSIASAEFELITEYHPGEGFMLKTSNDKFALTLGGYLQVRFIHNYFRWPDQPELRRQSTFRASRARIDFSGHLVTPKFTYKLEFDFARPKEIALDMYANYAPMKELQVKVGRFKVPYNRHELTSSSKMQFIERSFVNKYARDFIFRESERDFALEYNLGMDIHGFALDKIIEYHVSAFNGVDNHEKQQSLNFGEFNPHFSELLYCARIMVSPLGYVGYSDPDLEISKSPKFAIGASYFFEKEAQLQAGNPNRVNIYSYVVDGAFRFIGISFNGEYHFRTYEHRDVPNYGEPQVDAEAFIIQAGYLLPVWKRRIEIVGRYAKLNAFKPDEGFGAFVDQRDNEREYGGAVNCYFYNHQLKLSADYLIFITEFTARDTAPERRKQLRIQLQLKL